MRYLVNDNCIGCGLCASVCPGVFEMGPDGHAQAKDMNVSEEQAPDADAALEGCPVNAIEKY